VDEERERLVYDAERLRSVADEYDRLRRAAGVSPQARGQRFNEVVAEVLRCWGVPAKTSVRTTGELDVAFALDGVRYVMEVKWEAKPTDTGKIAKLQKRVRQRLLGTYGIFLSMSGYSPMPLT
jgi:Holliday junction resolvase-like predicted endonuclease